MIKKGEASGKDFKNCERETYDPAGAAQEYRCCEAPSAYPVCDLSSHVKNNELTIGVVSDTCLNSRYERLDILHTAYNLLNG